MDLILRWEGGERPLQLEDGRHTVGRGRDAQVRVPVASVSKTHAEIRIDGSKLYVRDLGSTNGTLVGGQSAGDSEVEVPAGTIIDFSGATLSRLASTAAADPPTPQRNPFLPGGGVPGGTVLTSFDVASDFSERARGRILGMLSGLFDLVASSGAPQEIREAACSYTGRSLTAGRVFLLEGNPGEALAVVSGWSSSGDPGEEPRVSQTLLQMVQQERRAVIVPDVSKAAEWKASESIADMSLRTLMAAPLFDNEQVRGILYVDSAEGKRRFDETDLQVLTATANAVAVKLRALELEAEVHTAARIQHAMLPRQFPSMDGWDMDAHLRMCREVGGDLYHCLPRPGEGRRVLLCVGDVAGKGIPAALAMGAAVVLLRSLNDTVPELPRLAEHLHGQLSRSLAPEQFITMFLAEIDLDSGSVHYLNAGHCPPIVRRANGDLEELMSTGLPVAMMESMSPEANGHAELLHGDTLLAFSDGVPEATKNGDELMGMDPVEAIMRSDGMNPLPELRRRILREVEDYLDGVPNSDDVTILLMRREA